MGLHPNAARPHLENAPCNHNPPPASAYGARAKARPPTNVKFASPLVPEREKQAIGAFPESGAHPSEKSVVKDVGAERSVALRRFAVPGVRGSAGRRGLVPRGQPNGA